MEARVLGVRCLKKEQPLAGELRGKCGAKVTAAVQESFKKLFAQRSKDVAGMAETTKEILGETVPELLVVTSTLRV